MMIVSRVGGLNAILNYMQKLSTSFICIKGAEVCMNTKAFCAEYFYIMFFLIKCKDKCMLLSAGYDFKFFFMSRE